MTLTYVFCLVRSTRKPRLPASPPGWAEVRALAAGGRLWVVVASAPAGEFDEAALARGLQDLDWVGPRALAHETVVEHFLSAAAVLPMQLFTLFTSDERALEHVEREWARIEAILARIERQLEWGLRLTFDEKRAKETVESRHAATRRATGAASGAAYLARKRDLFDVTRVQLADARAEADRLYAAMAGAATDARRRTATEQAAPGSRLLLDAAYLVPAARAASFRATLKEHSRRLAAAGLTVALTGPWPPYNFIAPAPAQTRARTRATSPARKAR